MTLDVVQSIAIMVGAFLSATTIGLNFWISSASRRFHAEKLQRSPKWVANFFRLSLMWVILCNLLIVGGGGYLSGLILANLAGEVVAEEFKQKIGVYLGCGIILGILSSIFTVVIWGRVKNKNTRGKKGSNPD